MDSYDNTFNKNLTGAQPTTIFRWPNSRRIKLRRRKLPTVRLGGKKQPRRGLFLVRMFRRVRLRSLKLKYSCMLKKLKEYYRTLMRDIIEASGTIEAFHQRILMETSLAVHVMGIPLISSFPNAYPSSDRM